MSDKGCHLEDGCAVAVEYAKALAAMERECNCWRIRAQHAEQVWEGWKSRAKTAEDLNAGLTAQLEAVRELITIMDPTGRERIDSPEDAVIEPLCEHWGYGAVMDAAMRLWRRKDPRGHLTIGAAWSLWRKALTARAEVPQ